MIQEIINFLFSIIQALVVVGVAGSVLKFRFSKSVNYGLFCTAVLIGAIGINTIGDSNIQGIIWLTLMGVFSQILYKGMFEVKIFYILAAQYICVASEMLLSTVLFTLPRNTFKVITNNICVITGISILIKAFVIIAGLIFIRYIHKIDPHLPRKCWIMLDIFLLVIIVSVQLLFQINLNMTNLVQSIYIVVLIYALLIFGIFIIYLLGKICLFYEMNIEYELLQLRRHELQKVIIYQKNMNDEIREIRHNMKKHLSNILYIMSNNQIDKAEQYIRNLTDDINNIKQNFYSGNYIIDAILNKQMVLCENKNIKLKLSVDEIPELNMNPADVSAVLDNLLDNAIEAVEKLTREQDIKVKLFIYKNNFSIVVKNGYEGTLNIKDGYLYTSKDRNKDHGYGIRTIKNIAEKNGGIFKYYIKEKEFIAVVMIPVVV